MRDHGELYQCEISGVKNSARRETNPVTTDSVDWRRRRFLLSATTTVGGITTVAAAVPFVASMLPSERAKAAQAPVEADIGKVERGTLATVEWSGKPVWVLHRTDNMIAALGTQDDQLRDARSEQPQQPDYVKNATRSIRPEYFVAIGICTHLGCVPSYAPQTGVAGLRADWSGGFYCPCHGSKFDLAGRVFRGVPAPLNLVIPPHKYLSDSRLLVGADPEIT